MVETFVQSTDDVVEFLKGQHNLIKDMFDDVLSASSDDARQKAFIELRQLLAVHETAEEMVVHPRAWVSWCPAGKMLLSPASKKSNWDHLEARTL